MTGTVAVPPAGTVTVGAPSVNASSFWVSARSSVTSASPVLVNVTSLVTAPSLGSCGQSKLPSRTEPVLRTVVLIAAATSTRPVPTSYGE